jgi:hypothetical protein
MEKGGGALVMAGHGHDDYVGTSTARYGDDRACILVAHAGTALSHRTRGARNGFNLLDIHDRTVDLVSYEWDAGERNFLAQPHAVYEELGLTRAGVPAGSAPATPEPEGRTFTQIPAESP